jgi:hypothetical protein
VIGCLGTNFHVLDKFVLFRNFQVASLDVL